MAAFNIARNGFKQIISPSKLTNKNSIVCQLNRLKSSSNSESTPLNGNNHITEVSLSEQIPGLQL
jgi:hypothetical protein